MQSLRFRQSVVIVFLFISALFVGCIQSRKGLLPDRVQSYHEAYKWKEYKRASYYVADPDNFLEKSRALGDDYEILDLDIISITINPDGKEAEVEVVRSYHVFPSVVVKRQRIVQQWKYDTQKKNWFLLSPY